MENSDHGTTYMRLGGVGGGGVGTGRLAAAGRIEERAPRAADGIGMNASAPIAICMHKKVHL